MISLLIAFLGLQTAIPTMAQKSRVRKTETSYYQTLVRISNEKGIIKKALMPPSKLPRGPVSLSVADDGNLVIGNQVGNSAVEIASAGEIIQKVVFKDAATISDVVKIGGEFFALNRNEEQPTILAASPITGETRKISNAPPDTLRFTGRDKGVKNYDRRK